MVFIKYYQAWGLLVAYCAAGAYGRVGCLRPFQGQSQIGQRWGYAHQQRVVSETDIGDPFYAEMGTGLSNAGTVIVLFACTVSSF